MKISMVSSSYSSLETKNIYTCKFEPSILSHGNHCHQERVSLRPCSLKGNRAIFGLDMLYFVLRTGGTYEVNTVQSYAKSMAKAHLGYERPSTRAPGR